MITAGPIPPNPSELLMSEKNINLIETLKNYYDFIVIDSPPVGLVADSFELMKYSDVNILCSKTRIHRKVYAENDY